MCGTSAVRIDTAEFPDANTLPESLRPMLFQNGMQIRPDPRFDNDVDCLLEAVRKPPSLSIVPSPREWLINILSHSLMPMGVWGLFYVVYCMLMYGIFRVLFGSTWHIEHAVAAFIAVPGFIIGAARGFASDHWRGGYGFVIRKRGDWPALYFADGYHNMPSTGSLERFRHGGLGSPTIRDGSRWSAAGGGKQCAAVSRGATAR